MAVAFVKNHTVYSDKASSTTAALVLATAVPAGNLIVCYMVYDNAATASKPLISSIARAAGETNTWATAVGVNSTSTTAGSFASGGMTYIRTTVSWPAATYTVTLDTATVQKAGFYQEFSGVLATPSTGTTAGTNYSTTTTAASAATTGTAPVIGDLTLGFIFGSNVAAAMAGDTDTTGGSWSAVAGVGSTGGNAATNNFGIAQYKILTSASHQTLNNSAAMTAGNGAIVLALQQYVPPAITQAAYGFYADGTETGSTTLASANTAITANMDSGDVNVLLRERLQLTTAVATDATDDWQLQWEKNASGSWVNVGTPYRLIDSQPDTTASGAGNSIGAAGGNTAISQSFTGTGDVLTRAVLRLRRTTGFAHPITVAIYAHSGTYGTTSVPTGTALATSTTVMNAADWPNTNDDWRNFDFAGFTLVNGTRYCLVISVPSGPDTNVVDVIESTIDTHSGNYGTRNNAGVWSALATGADIQFRVYATASPVPTTVLGYDSPNLVDGRATTNRLGAGTGTFVAGKVSEDGLVDDLGWTASNYTEVLYSVTLKAADLNNSDVLRFRTLYAGPQVVPPVLTYTQTPTINVTKTEVAVTQAAYRWYDEGTELGILVDSYSETNVTNLSSLGSSGSSAGQSFLGNGQPLGLASFYIGKAGTPTDDLTVKLYAHAGTFGSGGTPTGSALATSSPVSASSVVPGGAWVDFKFDGTYTLANGTPYFVVVTRSATDGTNYVSVGYDFTSSTHAGNGSLNGTAQAEDRAFRVFSVGALAAQNTAASGDVTTADGIGQLRVLLQSTSAAIVPSTDDWQLQWEKNASGTWANVAPLVPFDSYDSTNYSSTLNLGEFTTREVGQSFLGNGGKLSRVSFWMSKTLSPLSIQAKLYAHTGTLGTTGVPTGAALATSATRTAASFGGTLQWEDFVFDGTFTLAAGTPYFIALATAQSTSGNNYQVGYDSSTPTHPGNFASLISSWTASPSSDLIFRVYTAATVLAYNSPNLTDAAATTNRLTGGTGAFTAGKVSETGLVSDVGFSGNNFTELVYSLDVVNTDVVNGDTLRFRVLRNGVVTTMTYTQTPTLNVVKAAVGGKVKWYSGSAFTDKPVKWFNGSTWVEKPLKVYNGSTWVLA